MERNASPFVAHDKILHYVETLEQGNSWVIPSNLHIVGQSSLINFASPPTELKTTMIVGAWQSLIVQPTFPNPIVEGGPPTSNPIAERTTRPLHIPRIAGHIPL